VAVKLGLILENQGMRVFKNRMLRRMWAPTREKVTGTGKNCMRHFIIYTPY
jgi:hypothetical protein